MNKLEKLNEEYDKACKRVLNLEQELQEARKILEIKRNELLKEKIKHIELVKV